MLRFDAAGKLLTSFGTGMFVQAHGMAIDRDGNIWVTDAQTKDSKGQQVFKLSPEGKVLMTLGKAGVAGEGPDTFSGPADVVVAPSGDIFVADGHVAMSNGRVVKFSKDGKFIKAWGKLGAGPGEFNVPHSIAMDSRGRIFVADRSNSRLQIFDQDGKFIDQWKQFGRPSGVFIDKNDTIYVADSQSNATQNPGFKRGIRIGSAKDGKVTAFIPDSGPDPDKINNEGAEGHRGRRQGQRLRRRRHRDGVEEIRARSRSWKLVTRSSKLRASTLRASSQRATTSNSILISSFTFTVPPAMLIGMMPKSRCLSVTDPR